MEFLETAWKGFRNLKPRRQQWRPGLNVILGPNGSGKTNLLESFNVLSGWGAFTATAAAAAGGKTSSLIAWEAKEAKEAKIRALLMGRAAGERDVEVQAQIGARMSLRAGNERVTHSELRSLVPSLSFLPQDIGLLDGSPSVRRLFLDKLCALSSPLYARRLAEYKQLVRHRTALLRQDRKWRDAASALRATVPPIAQLGGWIRNSRRKVVDLLARAFSGVSGDLEISGENEPCSPSAALLPFRVEVALELRGGSGREDEKGEKDARDAVMALAAALETGLERERHAGSVLVGPHRDDLLFSCLGRPAAHSLSRGQKRRVVMATILAAGRLVEARLRLKPILLLDDVAAELDAEGKELMAQALADTGWQIFVTGVEDPFGDAPETRQKSQKLPKTLWRVQEGDLRMV
ncbi:MAG: DNA replication and repair protein RecF [Synergistaceae bacterium]|jgi:DNA replication and repair protein RecF|nr:DNA replication and repair protein RecF [Synergistaceae bacterium]